MARKKKKGGGSGRKEEEQRTKRKQIKHERRRWVSKETYIDAFILMTRSYPLPFESQKQGEKKEKRKSKTKTLYSPFNFLFDRLLTLPTQVITRSISDNCHEADFIAVAVFLNHFGRDGRRSLEVVRGSVRR